jgi:antitoxin FitA
MASSMSSSLATSQHALQTICMQRSKRKETPRRPGGGQKIIQVRRVPSDVHRTLCVRAAQEGLSLSDYVLRALHRWARQPTLAEVLARIDEQEPADPTIDAAAEVRAERDAPR